MNKPERIWRNKGILDEMEFVDFEDEPMGSNTTEYIRADLLQDPEFLDKAGLMVKPEKCGKCGDSGVADNPAYVLGFGSGYTESKYVQCPCTINPNSLYNVIKRLRG